MRRLIYFISALWIVIWLVLIGFEGLSRQEATKPIPRHARRTNPAELPRARYEGTIAHLDNLTPTKGPLDEAKEFIEENREIWRIQDYHTLKPDVSQTPLGTHISYQIYQGEFPIVGMRIVLQIASDRSIRVLQNNYEPVSQIEIDPTELNEEQLESWIVGYGYEPSVSDSKRNIVLYYRPGSDTPEPVYAITVSPKGTSHHQAPPVHLLIRVRDGQLLGRSVPRLN